MIVCNGHPCCPPPNMEFVELSGLPLYLECDDCFVGYNRVTDGNIALTLRKGKNTTVAYIARNCRRTDAFTRRSATVAGKMARTTLCPVGGSSL